MPSLGPTALLEFLRDHQFLEPSQSAEILNQHALPARVEALVDDLARRGWITSFVADMLRHGRHAELVLGPYRVLDCLGEGGMGQVFKARQVRLNRIVALKVIDQDQLPDSRAIQRFQREARAAAQLSHPHIVAAFDADQIGIRHFLAMEYVEGIDLARLVKQSGPLGIAKACEFIAQAASALQHAFSKGIVHRDIKPANLIVTRCSADAGSTQRTMVKVVDFGLARIENEIGFRSRLTLVGKIVGTVDYISPEQADNPRDVDIRSDIFSLGSTLFFLLTGQPPFPGKDLVEKLTALAMTPVRPVRSLRADIPAGVEDVLSKMMARHPAERYQTPAEVMSALEPFRRGLTPSVGSPLSPAPVKGIQRFPWRTPRAHILWGAVGLLAVGILLLLIFRPWHGSNQTDVLPPTIPVGELMLLQGHKGEVRAALFSPDGETVLSAGADQTIRLWSLKTGREIRQFLGHEKMVTSLAFAANGRRFLSGSHDFSVRFWEVASGKELGRMEVPGYWVNAVAISSDGRFALSGSDADRLMRKWDLEEKNEIVTFKGHGGRVFAVAFSPDDQLALSASEDGNVRAWNAMDGKLIATFKGHQKAVTSAVFSSDGNRILSGSHDFTVRLWQLDPARQLQELVIPSYWVMGAAISPMGDRALSGTDADALVRLWDLSTGKEIHRFTGHTAGIRSVAFARDGTRALSASADGTVRVWGLPK